MLYILALPLPNCKQTKHLNTYVILHKMNIYLLAYLKYRLPEQEDGDVMLQIYIILFWQFQNLWGILGMNRHLKHVRRLKHLGYLRHFRGEKLYMFYTSEMIAFYHWFLPLAINYLNSFKVCSYRWGHDNPTTVLMMSWIWFSPKDLQWCTVIKP